MPKAAPKPCAQVGCGMVVRDGTSRCPAHKLAHGRFADKRRGSRHERGYGTAWDKIRAAVLERDGGLCQPCLDQGHVTPGCSTVDHRVNKAQGGTDDPQNLQTICTPCHRAKTRQEASHGRAGGGEKSRAASARTERLAKLFTPAKTTPPGLGHRRVK